jgi:hypothetical protein
MGRDLTLGHLVAVGEEDHLPLVVGHRRQGRSNRRPGFGEVERSDRVVGGWTAGNRIGAQRPFERLQRRLVLDAGRRNEPRPPPRCAEPIDGAVAGYRGQPRGERPDLRIEALGAVPECQEHLLHDVFGDVTVTSEPERRCVDRGSVPVVERGQRGLGTRGHCRHEVGVGRERRRLPVGHRYAPKRPSVFGGPSSSGGAGTERCSWVTRQPNAGLVVTPLPLPGRAPHRGRP